ncbi:MAG: type IX secretion system membrane protein PorP/SprF [Sphingobacteriales bacterium]|nr:type IX secretion system membrane protein PorP/SprF [Sphingobacteriales bacterium]MCC7056853.1 type IX secretion system membrane protein PorP/SprF [Chitinophagales bacterium]MBK6889333.1 type IX secretion system membrane protein PorP/SprF [Sphingobacteriales bacterium]MBK7528166.1 type IX secretion system membrane protein PorP/SprF [Sphingobacteriales bacterium]MBK8679798.1 type IX secretion system membrane protein PorP/SprF [Sphingobacteriales bacterium]
MMPLVYGQGYYLPRELPNSSFYANNLLMTNPAIAGETDMPKLGLAAQYGWNKAAADTSAPLQIVGYWHGPATSIKSGFGLQANFVNFNNDDKDKILMLTGMYNYQQFLGGSEASYLRFGVGVGFIRFSTNDNGLFGTGGTGGTVIVPLIESKFKPKLDFGFLLRLGQASLGASFVNTNQPDYQFYQPGISFRFMRVMGVNAHYNWLVQKRWMLKPFIQLKQVLASKSFSVTYKPNLQYGLQTIFDEKFMFSACGYLNEYAAKYGLAVGVKVGGNNWLSLTYNGKKGTGYNFNMAGLSYTVNFDLED